jgi:hypothetical protein
VDLAQSRRKMPKNHIGECTMAIYEITADRFRPITETSFEANGLRERGDIQRLLRGQIEVISPGTLIIAEEFCEWEDSKRRIDFLGGRRSASCRTGCESGPSASCEAGWLR